MSTPSTSSPEEEPPRAIDIFQHLRLNLKNNSINCGCTILPDLYCIPCKTTVCKRCNYSFHKTHLVVSKRNAELNEEDINEIFKNMEEEFKSNKIYTQCDAIKNQLIVDNDKFAKNLIDKVIMMRDRKKEEIEKMFEHLSTYIKETKEQIDIIKKTLNEYHNTYSKFFCYKKENEDETNTIFLINYDMISHVYQKTLDLKGIAANLEKDLGNFNVVEEYQRDKIASEFDRNLFEEYNIDFVNEEYREKHLDITPDIKKDLSSNDEKYIPLNHFLFTTSRLNQTHFKEINERVIKYSKEIEAFKAKVYSSVERTNSYHDIEKELSLFENSKQKGADTLFTKRQPNAMTGSLTARSRLPNKEFIGGKIKLSSKEDVCLNDPLLTKYFAYMTIDLYGNYFRMMTKELQSSHADLMIKIEEEEETDFAKINEGTNILTIYDKKNNKLTKKKIPLTKNPYGYTVFPIGCRCLMIGDKIYITGGKDEKGVYANVLVYDRKTDKLKRIMDMVYPRCYHTFLLNDAFDTIMVFGGENENSVEIFDPLINRWIALPSMNCPRANVFFQFDKPRGLMYALFGNEGKIVDNKYSDVIEYLDLTNIKNGWTKMDYYNTSEAKLKTLLKIFPLSNNLLLAYGGESGRHKKKTVCVINLTRGEITKIDKQLAEQLKIESKKSLKLNNIVSSLNLN